MQGARRRDCWGCDNNLGKYGKGPCTCAESDRTREKRAWKDDIRREIAEKDDKSDA